MEFDRHTWALVLAAGEGSRLRSLTTTSKGTSVPKQFCSLCGGASLLQESLARASAIAARQRICTIVAAQHEAWWQRSLRSLPASNVIVQPQNRGTANGILFSLLHVLRRDCEARVVLLPSDHHVRDESVLADSLRQALTYIEQRPHACVLLGIQPDEADPELGYIVPVDDARAVCAVNSFVEKPSAESAQSLIARGALWNSFILIVRVAALLRMFERRFPDIVTQMRGVIECDQGRTSFAPATVDLYAQLPEIDFSRDIAQGHESELSVLRVPHCGWSDLGTPVRVAQTLRRLSPVAIRTANGGRDPCLNLSAQQARL
jgi:mannose-1-phosphate guanylyltransferase